MQPKNLGLKFAAVALLVALCLVSIWAYGLRQGTDLKGGHILTFEVQLPAGSSSDLVQQVINTLKERIDPTGLGELQWKAVGQNRFEVRMPMGTEEAAQAKKDFRRTMETLEDGNVQRSDLSRMGALADPQRDQAIKTLSKGNAAKAEALRKVAAAADDVAAKEKKLAELRNAGKPFAEAKKEVDRARLAHYKTQKAVLDANVNTKMLRDLLDLYVSQKEKGQLPKKEVKERTKELGDRLVELKARHCLECAKPQAQRDTSADAAKKHSARCGQIDLTVSTFKNWKENRVGLDDPADLKRLVAKAGVLEFRIAPILPIAGRQRELALSSADYRKYQDQLANEGPRAGHARNEVYLWFPVRAGTERLNPDMMIGKYAGKKYVLLYNQDTFTMLQRAGVDGKRPWSLTAFSTSDEFATPAVGFELDTRGAELMGLLTHDHLKHYMAILLDDEVYSAPVINATIYANGIITGSFTQDEVHDLVRILNAGALSARVNPDPVSEKTIGPSFGKDNREAGFRAAIVGLIAVAAFMMIYYLAAGAIADMALMLNIVLVVGAMSLFYAVWTLPGIAGVILTIGMAVDANVLIFERLREEQAKTQSMRMAIRNAYSNAASAILDGNATTLITCFILGYVGTEEVRGFAITLGLGVVFSLFTALVVTRWVFQLLVETGLVRSRVKMLAFIGTPRINWMAKRRVFWMVSVVLVVAGILAVTGQGKDLLGLEFSAGTQAVFNFKTSGETGGLVPNGKGENVLPERAAIEDAIRSTSRTIIAKRLPQARTNVDGLAGQVDDLTKKIKDLEAQKTAAVDETKTNELGARIETAERELSDLTAQLARARERVRALSVFPESIKVETIIEPDQAAQWLKDRFGKKLNGSVTREEFLAKRHSAKLFEAVDADGDGKLTREELEGLPQWTYQVSTTVADVALLRDVVSDAFGAALKQSARVTFDLQTSGEAGGLNVELDPKDEGRTHVTAKLAKSEKLNPILKQMFEDAVGGVLFVIRSVQPALTEDDLRERIGTMRDQPDFAGYRYNKTTVIGLQAAGSGEGFTSFAVLVLNPGADYVARPDEWKAFADDELGLLTAALERTKSLESLQEFDSVWAQRAVMRAGMAFVLSWLAIIAYLWLRFGSARWGLAAVVCLVHDVLLAVGLLAAGAYLAKTFIGPALLIEAFKIDMAVVAAFLTIIGYSVNDTIVVFDRIRENRGKLTTVDENTINKSINQTISRTLLTTTSTLIAVVVMYIWGGPGIHAFTFALLVGIIFGTYSSIAIASPLLLGFKHAIVGGVVPAAAGRGRTKGK